MLDTGFAVIPFREHKGQPDCAQPAGAQPLMMPVTTQMRVQQRGQAQVLHQSNQQRHIIHAFVGQAEFGHGAECTTEFRFPNKRLRER